MKAIIEKSPMAAFRRVKSEGPGVTVVTRRTQQLLSECMDLRTLLDAMEHDKSLEAAPWQVTSVKEQLRKIEYQIRMSRYGKVTHKYGHR